jgi:hypothetical protein
MELLVDTEKIIKTSLGTIFYFVLYVLLLLLCPDKVTFYIQTHNLGE